MLVKCATRAEIDNALSKTAVEFGNNVCFNRMEPRGKQFIVTLRVKSSKCLGHRLSHRGRRLVSACWHVHGTFMDYLPPQAKILTSRRSTNSKAISPGDKWEDFDIGSMIFPLYMSEACEC